MRLNDIERIGLVVVGGWPVNTEDLYIGLYEDIIPSAEYLQADSEHRNFLPEAVIIAGLGAVLKIFAEKLFETLGDKTAELSFEKIIGIFSSAEKKGDRDAMLEGLELIQPFLENLQKMTSDQQEILRDVIAANLEKRGYPADVAKSTSADLFDRLATKDGQERS